MTRVYNFLRYRWACFIGSLLICAAFVGGVVYKRSLRGSAFTYSVDFTGGTQMLFNFSQPVQSDSVLSLLEKNGFSGASLREFSEKELMVRVKSTEKDGKTAASFVHSLLQEEMPEKHPELKQTDSVGSGIGAELRYNSILAVIFALIGMLVYIGFRFQSLAFATGSVVALAHDTLVILTFVLWFDYEISLNIIGALLFILGYSINDTIVIFSRIRENVRHQSKKALYEVVNTSISETLRRTLLTSIATLLVVVSLLIFGGEVLRTLALALCIGMIFGTYSSIYIASPVMLLLYDGSSRKNVQTHTST